MPRPRTSPPPALGAGCVRRAGLILGAAAVLSLGCTDPIPKLVRSVEEDHFCPAARVVVKARDDLTVHEVLCRAKPRLEAFADQGFWRGRPVRNIDCGEAPPDLRSDPGRLRLFEELRGRKFAAIDACGSWTVGPCSVRIFEVTACGAHVLYACDGEWCSTMGLPP